MSSTICPRCRTVVDPLAPNSHGGTQCPRCYTVLSRKAPSSRRRHGREHRDHRQRFGDEKRLLGTLYAERPELFASVRTYLYVPFAEKDVAKSRGARWDPERRQWYVPGTVPIGLFSRWTNPPGRPATGGIRLLTGAPIPRFDPPAPREDRQFGSALVTRRRTGVFVCSRCGIGHHLGEGAGGTCSSCATSSISHAWTPERQDYSGAHGSPDTSLALVSHGRLDESTLSNSFIHPRAT